EWKEGVKGGGGGRRQERLDEFTLLDDINVGYRGGTLHTPPRAARQLPRCSGRTTDQWSDILERYSEHVMEDEREALVSLKCLQDDEKRKTDGVRQKRRVLRIDAVIHPVDDGVRQAYRDRHLAA